MKNEICVFLLVALLLTGCTATRPPASTSETIPDVFQEATKASEEPQVSTSVEANNTDDLGGLGIGAADEPLKDEYGPLKLKAPGRFGKPGPVFFCSLMANPSHIVWKVKAHTPTATAFTLNPRTKCMTCSSPQLPGRAAIPWKSTFSPYKSQNTCHRTGLLV